ncbi:hypothetical protein D6779_12135 [Candidatus Parcubacteria bacterium]|nr:MAG: hypothetical protein D6779_12135 [Candidatus Parcubacteria bacterium]
MSDKERLYHKMNVYFIPAAVASGLLALLISPIAQSMAQNNPDGGALALAPLFFLLLIVFGLGVLWTIISGIINEKVRETVILNLRRFFKYVIGVIVSAGWMACLLGPFELIVGMFLFALVASVIFLLWEIWVAVLAIYLFVTSRRALRTNTSIFTF